MSLRPSLEGGGLLHASCVAVEGKAVVITGASGSGKSALALELMSRGADLVADDQVILTDVDGSISATSPRSLKGLIEARCVGLLRATSVHVAQVSLWIDLDQEQSARLPGQHTMTCFGVSIPLLYNVPHPHFSPAILQYLKHGREA